MGIIKTADIRQSFLEYFKNHDHRVVPSSPVIPFEDPTLLFINAGMNQFKDIFTGQRAVEYSRATSVQKCLRAGGKHNDLDNVGFTARHHTFFEMLGNFSFGDYFKEEAISYAWEWVTGVLKLPKDKIWASVYEEDDEAFALWEKIAPELRNGRILRFGKKDNYWSMGNVGPCGPCSEIHFDRGEKFGTGPQDVVNGETERFVEIWNLVFMQFDQTQDGKVIPLPKPSVDTGAGLERIAAIMQGKESNYETDLFVNLIAAISDVTGAKYADHRSSHHVIADHLRALSFSLADGAGVSNEGRGYVLRRILRRAVYHGSLLGAKEAFIYKLVPALVDEMGPAYPELIKMKQLIQHVLKAEEESFGRTLDNGLELFHNLAKSLKLSGLTVIPGDEVFKLRDTYGIPYDLIEILANDQGLTLDRKGYDRAMSEQQARSRSAITNTRNKLILEQFDSDVNSGISTEFVRSKTKIKTKIVDVRQPPTDLNEPYAMPITVVLEETPFYVESGGQISDTGKLFNTEIEIRVTRMYLQDGFRIHYGIIDKGNRETIHKGMEITAEVDAPLRWDIMRNHTATHLAQKALQIVLGDHVKQSGSYVGPDRLRFDFSHHQPMTPDEIAKIEQIVNEQILLGTDVVTVQMPVAEAKKSGAMALFGEKYGDIVRVVSVGDFSKELCGGTHVQNIGQIGPFIVTSETGVASGVRRLEAITGREALKQLQENREQLRRIGDIVGRSGSEVAHGVKQIQESNSALQKDLKKTRAEMFSGGNSIGSEEVIKNLTYIKHDFGATDKETIAAWIDSQRARTEAVIAVGFGSADSKMNVMFGASASAVKQLGLHSGSLAKEILPQFGGRGGGKPSFAQGSVAAGTIANDLFEKVMESIKKGQEGA